MALRARGGNANPGRAKASFIRECAAAVPAAVRARQEPVGADRGCWLPTRLAAQQAKGNREVASEREQLAARVRAELEVADNGPLVTDEQIRLRETTRAIQDGIHRTRKRSERVPRQIYEHFRDKDEDDMRETAAETVHRLHQ